MEPSCVSSHGGFLFSEESVLVKFYGFLWVLQIDGSRTGFFDKEMNAVRYLQSQISVTERGGKGDE